MSDSVNDIEHIRSLAHENQDEDIILSMCDEVEILRAKLEEAEEVKISAAEVEDGDIYVVFKWPFDENPKLNHILKIQKDQSDE